MEDVKFCPFCGGMIEAGGDDQCICDELADDEYYENQKIEDNNKKNKI